MAIVNLPRVSLKNNPKINEAMIQKYIFEHPDVLSEALGSGKLVSIKREKSYESGGRLDILLEDDDNCRYEVEIQLGATDPSHIIRTIEYWDNENKRNPMHSHCAVIIAEEITGRFMNVISLFNNNIQLIAIQMSAYEVGNDILLAFTRVLDKVIREDEDIISEPTERPYWEKKSNKEQMALFDEVFSRISDYAPGIKPKYNKIYIGLEKDGIARNFVYFKPHKQFVAMFIRAREDKLDSFDNCGLDIDYSSRLRHYRVRMKNIQEFDDNNEVLRTLICEAKDLFNIDD